ncbi:AraC-like DNA-binding protein/quercetin dioxygenase-like cupin family protein [Pullulanibacillus pueri]|uniref:HTH araC/xylS-type domain-containing protein n=1 Tax=Pullulanibacillus pueri TaxID=1437324 RepID=A0A8J2ZSM1_9BACL|nr:AraC family transcriptional regulator [Pullulanibacillus pueri]MBM7680274.1 AraC-like DNA-binding protein/quercetin dioxygenase-like cupin family protein [Pullulanibacillus pueri]GGH75894.1 hypothetical protein GCM10007096_05590 [Pullulanibacillus pueri]
MTQTTVRIGPLFNLHPTVNFANQMVTFPGQEWGPRTIPDCQLLYVISGKAELYLGSQQFHLSSGDTIFYGPNSPHHLISSRLDPMTFASVHYSWDQSSIDPIHPDYGIRYHGAWTLDQPPENYSIEVNGYGELIFPHYITSSAVEDLFLQIVREYRSEGPGYPLVLRGLLIQLLTAILRQQIKGQHSPIALKKIAPALEAIRNEENFNWKMEDLAAICGYHPTYFAQLFKEATGQSPKHYLMQERIRKAKFLLLEESGVNEVAINLGYSSPHYFCRNFKEITGLTPTEFKRRSAEL